MWQIYADADLIYDSQYQDRMITQGEFDLEVNHSGSFTFVMYPDHPLYNVLTELKSIVKAYRNNDLIYRGRIIRRPDGFNLDRTFICEGELSFLVDGIVRPYSFSGSPKQLFTNLIEEYNTQVSEDRRFKVGLVTVTDPNNYIIRANSNYPNTLDELMDKLVEPLGGYIVFTSDGSGDRVINWLQNYPSRPVQSIDFGENLLDYANVRSAEQIATALIPLGAKLPATDDIEPRLTIESVNDGKDYIYDEDAVRRYGWIYTTRVWDDVTLPENLFTKGRAALAELVMPTESIELSALDMSALDADISAFRLGDIVPVRSEPHNLNSAYLLSKQTIDVLRPEANRITLGYSGQRLTSATLTTAKLGSQVTDLATGRDRDRQSLVTLANSVTEIRDIQEQDAEVIGGALDDLSTDLSALNDKVDNMYLYRDAIDVDDVTIGANGAWALGREDISVDGYVAEEIVSFGVYAATHSGAAANWCIFTRLYIWPGSQLDAYVWNQYTGGAAKVRIIIRVKYRKQ